MAENKEYFCTAGDKGSVNISEDVIAQIAAAAMADTEGVGAPATAVGRELNRKNHTRSAKITYEEDKLRIDASLSVKQGYSIAEVAKNVQEAIWDAVESTTGIPIKCVNVQVSGISISKEK